MVEEQEARTSAAFNHKILEARESRYISLYEGRSQTATWYLGAESSLRTLASTLWVAVIDEERTKDIALDHLKEEHWENVDFLEFLEGLED